MAIGFPARFTESRTYHLGQDELVAAVKSALANLNWPYKELPGEGLLASVPFSGWTWGADFRVVVLPDGALAAESKCVTVRMPQVFDFGKNRQNVETFFAMVEHCIGRGVEEGGAPAAVPEPSGRVEGAAPQRRWAGTLLGGCLIGTLVIFALTYFISAVVGLLTGYLFLPGRGGGGGVVQGPWARVISGAILALFAWIIIRLARSRKRGRR